MSDGGTIASTRNKNMIGKCDIYIFNMFWKR